MNNINQDSINKQENKLKYFYKKYKRKMRVWQVRVCLRTKRSHLAPQYI